MQHHSLARVAASIAAGFATLGAEPVSIVGAGCSSRAASCSRVFHTTSATSAAITRPAPTIARLISDDAITRRSSEPMPSHPTPR